MSNKAKLYPVIEKEGDTEPCSYMFLCPGCESYHSLNVLKSNSKGGIWKFNGNLVKPSFTPSLLVTLPDQICHSFIKDGYITFLDDCTHKMKGVTTSLLDID